MKHTGHGGLLITGLLLQVLFIPGSALAQSGGERIWSSQSANSVYRTEPARTNERYNPWEKLGGESQATQPEQSRYLERPRREFQPEVRPVYPSPSEYRAQVPTVAPYGMAPVYPQARHYAPYSGGGYTGSPPFSPYGGAWPIPGGMPWGFMPW